MDASPFADSALHLGHRHRIRRCPRRSEALLGPLLGETVANAYLGPRGPVISGQLNVDRLQLLGRLPQATGGIEPINRILRPSTCFKGGHNPMFGAPTCHARQSTGSTLDTADSRDVNRRHNIDKITG
jgi:hypothetical protein